MFINKMEINELLKVTNLDVDSILNKALNLEQLTYEEIATLLNVSDETNINKLLNVAGEIKHKLYKNRIVLFAPLYVSDYCKNNCHYCGYKRENQFKRRKLSREEIISEVKALEAMGHKRLALEVGEDELNFSFEEVLETIDTIYSAGDIRRINVNIAATTTENYKKLHAKDIGTYILFQETYDQDAYEKFHKGGLKGNYERQLLAMHRAMDGGIGDVGGGVLYGLSDYRFDTIAMIMHNRELENKYGVGFHTVSVPRLQKAPGMDISDYPHIISDLEFKKIVAILRLAMPYLGIIMSTRENEAMRNELIKYGVTQISAGSKTGVGGYSEEDKNEQFTTNDERSPLELKKDLVRQGLLPSYCTACYRIGRVGVEFIDIVKAGKIGEMCAPNALITFAEYIEDFGDSELKTLGYDFINKELDEITNERLRASIIKLITKIKNGERDLYI